MTSHHQKSNTMAEGRSKFVFIEDPSVSEILQENVETLIKDLESAFSYLSKRDAGGIVQPVRSTIGLSDVDGFLLSMPAYSKYHGALAVKLLSLFPQPHGLKSNVMYFDTQSGAMKAVIEGNILTVMRTTAATLVAVKHLASKDASKLAVIGCGDEGKCHAKLMKHVRNFSEVRLWNRTASTAAKLAEEIGGIACSSVEEAVKDADVIITTTSSKVTVLQGKWVKKGALVNIVGANRPDYREADDDLMKSSQIIADTKDGVAVEAGDVVLSGVEIDGELGDVINGTLKPDFSRTRVFKSQGMAVEDVVAAKLVYEKFIAKENPQ